MVRFWEGSRSPSGSCGSRNFLKKDNFEKLFTDFDEIFRNCPKWDKELLMVGFESPGIELHWRRSALSECSCLKFNARNQAMDPVAKKRLMICCTNNTIFIFE